MMIHDLLDWINLYGHWFRHMVELERDDRLARQETRDVSVFFSKDKNGDRRRYTTLRVGGIAAVFLAEDAGTPKERGIVSHSRN